MTHLTEIIESLQELKIVHEQCQRELELMKEFLATSRANCLKLEREYNEKFKKDVASNPPRNGPIFHTEQIEKPKAKRGRKPKVEVVPRGPTYIELDKALSKKNRLESTSEMIKQRVKKNKTK